LDKSSYESLFFFSEVEFVIKVLVTLFDVMVIEFIELLPLFYVVFWELLGDGFYGVCVGF
jgi:hypothetical protein